MDNNTKIKAQTRQLFDIRPVNFKTADGNLMRIKKKSVVKRVQDQNSYSAYNFSKPRLRRMGKLYSSDRIPVYSEASEFELKQAGIGSVDFEDNIDNDNNSLLREIQSNKFSNKKNFESNLEEEKFFHSENDEDGSVNIYKQDDYYQEEVDSGKINFTKRKFDFLSVLRQLFNKTYLAYGLSAGFLFCIVMGGVYVWKGLQMKGGLMASSAQGYSNLMDAVQNIKDQKFFNSQSDFDEAYENFSKVSEDLESFGNFLIEGSHYIPFISKLSTGKNMAEAGKHISLAGKSLSKVIDTINDLDNPFDYQNESSVSLLDVLQSITGYLEDVKKELKETDAYLAKVKIDDLPEDKRDQFAMLKDKLPEFNEAVDSFINNNHIFTEMLGGYGPRKYLFLFENNHEARPGGGFIGSYALLEMKNGRVRNFFVDGIFNPDGQLQSKIVPPKPIQKVSANWSLHDSNWFPNFPDSAKKAIYFYEETGGPTADGVIALTPVIMEKMLEITGPVEMPQYEVTLTADNFIEKTQYEVEIDYDKQENRPKKILSDLTPIILDRVFNSKDPIAIMKTLTVFSAGLKEKQIMFYSSNPDLQSIIARQGWSGEILNTQKDYLNVVNANINGFKTDGIINQTIDHRAEIQADGSIVDTVTITRKHNGGTSGYQWWDSVNANYMRVLVPLGSKLLSAQGHTREVNDDPIDYDALGYKRDADLQKIADSAEVDEESGTIITKYSDKTVFENWVYVSPQETVAVEYKYLLPFKLNFDGSNEKVDSYSLLAQKQLGGIKTKFSMDISYPDDLTVVWTNVDDGGEKGGLFYSADFNADQYVGMVFQK